MAEVNQKQQPEKTKLEVLPITKKMNGFEKILAMSKTPTKLYAAHSVLSEFCGHENVRIDWYFHERISPIAQSDKLIKGFSALDREKQVHFSGFVNELFREIDLDKLHCCVEPIHNSEIITEEIAIPIDPHSFSFRRFMDRTIGKLSGYYMLTEIKGFDMSFPVWGYFDLKCTDVTDEIWEKADDMSIFMIEQLLISKGLDPDLSTEVLERKIGVFEDVYHRFMQEGKDLLTEVELRKIPCKVWFDMCLSRI
jgi:hypothetical protein